MTSDTEEKPFVGTDGKEIKLKHSKIITSTPWYVEKEDTQPTKSSYEAKRDVYEEYDPETYKTVIQSFNKNKSKKKKKKLCTNTNSTPIYDTYSRTTLKESQRSRTDTAHYLKDLNPFGDLEFEENNRGDMSKHENNQNNTARAAQDAGHLHGIASREAVSDDETTGGSRELTK